MNIASLPPIPSGNDGRQAKLARSCGECGSDQMGRKYCQRCGAVRSLIAPPAASTTTGPKGESSDTAGQSRYAPPLDGWALFSAHHGSGASTWAALTGATEVSGAFGAGGNLIVAARTTLQGIESAKRFTELAGVLLLVADAPGRYPADVRRGIRVLAGARPVVQVPWVPALRGLLAPPESPAIARASIKTIVAIRDKKGTS